MLSHESTLRKLVKARDAIVSTTEFATLPRRQQESLTMPEIIKSLRKLGGRALTKKVREDILVRDNVIPEEFITHKVVSQQSGKSYYPFAYIFNFSVANLDFAGFLTRPRRGEVELTKLGRDYDLNQLDVQRDIYRKADPQWKKRRTQKLAKRQLAESTETDESMVEDDPADDWRSTLQTALMAISPAKFELFARRLVQAMGVDLDEKIGVKLSGDGGLDGFGYLTTDDFRTARVAIQAKRWSSMVPSPEIDKFRGAMDKYNAEFGIFVTTSDFSRDAIRAARTGTRVITLINGERLIDLVAKYELYVKPVVTYELEDFFKEVD